MHNRFKIFFLLIMLVCIGNISSAKASFFGKKDKKEITKTEKVETASETKERITPDISNYLLSLQAKQNKDYKKAVEYLELAIKSDPDNALLSSEMFGLLLMEGNVEKLYPYALKEIKLMPNSLLGALSLIAYYAKNNDFEKALQEIQNFPEKKENGFLFPLFEVWVYAGLNNKEKALEALEQLNQTELETLYAFYSALIYDLFDDEDEAKKHYESLLVQPGGLSLRAAQAYGNFLLRTGDNKKFNVLMNAYQKGGKSYPLIDERFFTAGAKNISKDIPKSVNSAKSGIAEAFFDVAGSINERGSSETSLFFAQMSLSLDSSLSLARMLLGGIFEGQERYDDALNLYMEETPDSETYYASQIRMAMLYAKKGDIKKAESMLKELAKKRNDLAFPWSELGNIYIENEMYNDAISAFNQAISKKVVPDRNDWILFYNRGVSYEKTDQWDLAEQDLLQALMLAPDQPITLNYLGYSWIEKGKNIGKAKEMIEKAAFLAPREGFIADSLGWIHYLLKDYDKAVRHLEKAIRLDPKSGQINAHLGDAYWRVGRKREAKFQWEKSLALEDDFAKGEKEKVKLKIEKGLDAVGDKITLPEKIIKRAKAYK